MLGQKQETTQPRPSFVSQPETSTTAQNLAQHWAHAGFFPTPSPPGSVITPASPGTPTESRFSRSDGLQKGIAFVSSNTKLKKTQGYISMACGRFEKNGFPAALCVLKPISCLLFCLTGEARVGLMRHHWHNLYSILPPFPLLTFSSLALATVESFAFEERHRLSCCITSLSLGPRPEPAERGKV